MDDWEEVHHCVKQKIVSISDTGNYTCFMKETKDIVTEVRLLVMRAKIDEPRLQLILYYNKTTRPGRLTMVWEISNVKHGFEREYVNLENL
ncbi:unnamed protein product [Strongylus vulgaris]|uniref:Uncharacterized protein n=1 Tax=Strongylus vulgaris TaxID=40348 RepID=A0A3P7KDN2_STRVU|nr:unnamed protein product [Strongylus vulgaris]